MVPPLSQAHAHNDQRNTPPLRDALANGFTSIEVDIFLVGENFLIGSVPRDIQRERSLRRFYLDPLRERVRQNGGSVYLNGPQVILMIDIKSDAKATYYKLHDVLAEYSDIFTSFGPDGRQDKAVLVVVSGNRPARLMASQKVRYACLDGRLEDLHSNTSIDMMPLISASWPKHFTWKGQGEMPSDEQRKLQQIVQSSHKEGKRVRFWDTPDNASPERGALWDKLLSLGVDLINTDDLEDLKNFLLRSSTCKCTRAE